MNVIDKIKHKFAKWIWRNNAWAIAITDIEKAFDELRQGKATEVILHWHFSFLRTPNRFTISIKLSPKDKDV